MSTAMNASAERPHLNRWMQLFLGIVCTAMIANLPAMTRCIS
jgi:hypothetical protein